MGFSTENFNETKKRIPTSVHQQFTDVTPAGFNVSETFIRGYNNDTSGQHDDWVMEGKQGSAIVNIRTGELWNGSDPFLFLNTTFGYSGRFYHIPVGLYGDSYVIIPGGEPQILGALGRVVSMADWRDGVSCTKVQYTTTFLTGNKTSFLNGTVWFDNMYGLLHELILSNETEVLVHIRKRNDAVTGLVNNPQLQDSTFMNLVGYSLHNDSGN